MQGRASASIRDACVRAHLSASQSKCSWGRREKDMSLIWVLGEKNVHMRCSITAAAEQRSCTAFYLTRAFVCTDMRIEKKSVRVQHCCSFLDAWFYEHDWVPRQGAPHKGKRAQKPLWDHAATERAICSQHNRATWTWSCHLSFHAIFSPCVSFLGAQS